MNIGFEPFVTPFNETAIDDAKEFIRSRGLTARDVKLQKRDDQVRVVVIRNGVKLVCNDGK